MSAAPYTSPEQHLREHIEVLQLMLAAAERRRQLAARGDDLAGDEELTRAAHAIVARDAAMAARVEASDPVLVPLERLRRTFHLSPRELRILVLLTALELDTRLRERVRAWVGDGSRPHADLGLLSDLFYAADDRIHVPRELGADGKLTRFALMRTERMSDVPFALRRARPSERVVELMCGRDVLDREVARHAELVPPTPRAGLVLDDAIFDEVTGLLAAAGHAAGLGRAHPVVVISGSEGAGRKSLVAAAAHHLGMAVLRVRCASLPRDEGFLRGIGPAILREAVLWRAAILLDSPDALALDHPGFRLDEALFGTFAGPIAAVVDRITGRPPQMARGTVILELEVPPEPAREAMWRRALPGGGGEVASWAAARYTVGPGVVIATAEAARARAAARARTGGAADVTADDIHVGLRSALDAKLATLGSRIAWRQTWDDLVLPEDNVAEIREFIARVRHRRLVYETWGFGRKVAKGLGLSALFAGAPGTGKTMVAGLIADELKLDLYQVDLSKVVSKWIGETEKNLAGLFEAAEAGHAILLFDEADSLFAKRTEVKSSNDRYANLEINYLLQRMEAFSGITILTTNNDTSIDPAFRRRLSLKIDFPIPEADERERLWRSMFPPQARLADDLDFSTLAQRFEMTGGYIKNAAVRAAFLAADEGTPITMALLVRAARSEYAAMGKVIGQH